MDNLFLEKSHTFIAQFVFWVISAALALSRGWTFDFTDGAVPSLESVWRRSCHLSTAQWTWWQPCPPSTGSTGHAFSRRPTESWSLVAAWLCSTTPWTWSSATLTAAQTHSIKCAKRCFWVTVNVHQHTLRHMCRDKCARRTFDILTSHNRKTI